MKVSRSASLQPRTASGPADGAEGGEEPRETVLRVSAGNGAQLPLLFVEGEQSRRRDQFDRGDTVVAGRGGDEGSEVAASRRGGEGARGVVRWRLCPRFP